MTPNNVKLSWFGLFDDVILPSHCRFEGGICLMGRVIFLSRPTRTLKFLACTAFIELKIDVVIMQDSQASSYFWLVPSYGIDFTHFVDRINIPATFYTPTFWQHTHLTIASSSIQKMPENWNAFHEDEVTSTTSLLHSTPPGIQWYQEPTGM